MKKIIAVIALSLSFGFSAKAQQTSKAAPQQSVSSNGDQTSEENIMKMKAFKEIDEVAVAVGKLEESLQRDLTTLLMMRMDAVANATTEEEKKSLFNRFTNKFLGGLSPDQLENLKKNKELYTRLTEYRKN